MIPLTDAEKAQHNSQKVCFLCKKEFCYDKTNTGVTSTFG